MSHFKLGESHELFGAVRRKITNPLHRIISYSELLFEESPDRKSAVADTKIAELLDFCEATLFKIRLAFEGRSSLELVNSFEQVHKWLIDSCPELIRITNQLELITGSETSFEFGSDIRKIQRIAIEFQDLLTTLVAPEIQTASSPQIPSAKIVATSVALADEQLIIQTEYRGLLLIVDDDESNRDVLSRRLLREGYEVMLAESGKQAIRMLARYDFDLILLDIMMPEMDGTAVLAELKRNPALSQLPVVMITAVDEIEIIAQCIEAGADDYLLKPFNAVLLKARIGALLQKKRLQDEQKSQRKNLEKILEENKKQKEEVEQLLLNILPAVVARELKEFNVVKPMYFEDVSIVFADVVGFTHSTEFLPADELVEVLNRHFTKCDRIIAKYNLEKLKTIGDCYMFAGGLPTRNPSHPVDCVLAASEMIQAMEELSTSCNVKWQLRIGINTGPVIAGVVGIHKFAFDIWGDSVNFASRIESCGASGRINLSSSTFVRIKDFFSCEKRENVRIKDGKEVDMFFVNGISQGFSDKPDISTISAFQSRYSTYFRKDLQAFPEFLFQKEWPS